MRIKNLKKSLALSVLISASALSITMMPEKNVLGMGSKQNDNDISASDSILSSSKDIYNSFLMNWNAMDKFVQHRDSLIQRQSTIDSLVNQAKNSLGISILCDSYYADSVVNTAINRALTRPKINQEVLVDKILDTLNTGSEVVDRYFIKASIQEESGYDPSISSYAHAQGLLQLMKDTWAVFGEGSYSKNVRNPIKNIRAGVRYYMWLEKFMSEEYAGWSDASLEYKRGLLLAAYNGGHNRLKHRKFDIKKMPKESRDHIIKVNNTIAELRTEDLLKELALYCRVSASQPQNYLAYVDFK